ncbi:hypothetical protein [Streptomyces sp. NPDC057939]|uniref:hypothetical protein n=1 Tax=Streptomyces sp. NPDC057939 TaxID=3346284 RepID=UPI0036EEBD8D
MRFPRNRATSVAILLTAATALAVIGPFTAKFDNPACQAVSLVFSGGWSWACFAFLVGFSRRSWIGATALASSSLAMAVVVYYVFKFSSRPPSPACPGIPFRWTSWCRK